MRNPKPGLVLVGAVGQQTLHYLPDAKRQTADARGIQCGEHLLLVPSSVLWSLRPLGACSEGEESRRCEKLCVFPKTPQAYREAPRRLCSLDTPPFMTAVPRGARRASRHPFAAATSKAVLPLCSALSCGKPAYPMHTQCPFHLGLKAIGKLP